MKRALTTLLVIALVGSMMFAGFAGTAAAGADEKADKNDKHDDEKHADDKKDDKADDKKNGDDGHDDHTQKAGQATSIDQYSSAEVNQHQKSQQANVNEGDQTALALSYKGSADASNTVAQANVNTQAASATSFNVAGVSQDIDQDHSDD